MKWNKVISVFCVTAMAACMLAGCGSAGNGTDAADSQDSEDVSGEAKEPTEIYDHEAIENAGDITLTMMVSGTAYENDFETEQLPKLVKEKWPNVTLEVTKLPDDNYYTSLKTKLASGECPDIILTQPMYAGQNSCYSMAEAGYLVPLNDLDCAKGRQDLSSVTYKGDIMTISNSISILGCYYNKDLFEQAGISAEPQSWDEFLEDCKKLKDAGIQPIVMGDKDQYVLQFGLYQLAANEIYSKNAEYDTQLRTGDTSFTDEGTWDTVLEMYKTLYDNQYIDASQSLGYGASQAITDFIDGKAAMTFDGSFNATALTATGAAGDFERVISRFRARTAFIRQPVLVRATAFTAVLTMWTSARSCWTTGWMESQTCGKHSFQPEGLSQRMAKARILHRTMSCSSRLWSCSMRERAFTGATRHGLQEPRRRWKPFSVKW